MATGTSLILPARCVAIPTAGGRLLGDLYRPEGAAALIVFAHGGGSNRSSPRNQLIARSLQEAGWATLMLDLIAEGESEVQRKMFDIGLQADRIRTAADWLGKGEETHEFRVGFFGAGTGAAAVLRAAARRPQAVGAVVCRGAWTDLAWRDLPFVAAPTLLIVGGRDGGIPEMNRQALYLFRCPRELAVIPGATHFFTEPGTLEEVARRTTAWFGRYLTPAKRT